MPAIGLRAAGILSLLSAMATGVCALPQATQSIPSEQQNPWRQSQSPQSSYVLKVTTRLVTLDLIATDSHGRPVRDLQAKDVQVFEEHNARQEVTQFEFVDHTTSPGTPKAFTPDSRAPARVYSNQIAFDELKIPPTVLLIDGVNTQTVNQMQGRVHMLQMLKTLPANTPVAVFLLGSSLKVLQGFTSDGNLLRAAVDHALVGNSIDQDPADSPDSLSNLMLDPSTLAADSGAAQQTQLIGLIQDFEKEQYANTMDLRVRKTLQALTSIAQYLSGLPGRKNLIWVSESFPFSITPNMDTGTSAFAGIRNYSEQVTTAANALTDAQVAVYPVDVVGLATQQAFSASQSQIGMRSSSGRQLGQQLSREQNARFESQGTMDELANDTGGKTCKNTNDLSGCVIKALDDSSSYYEVAFYPQNVNWDGKFHKIVVKTSRPGVKLAYRRGYFALDAVGLAKNKQPGDRLFDACSDLLPSTAVQLTAQTMPPGQSSTAPRGLQYLLSISAEGIGFSQAGDSRKVSLLLAVCEFGGKDQSFRFSARDLNGTVTDKVFRSWQDGGIPDIVTVAPASNTRRIRFVLLDVSTGLTGAIDVPVLPSEIAKAAEAPSARPVTPSFVDLPDKGQTSSPPAPMGALSFRSKSGESGSLDWNGDSLLYRGDLSIDQAAAAFFSFAFQSKFSCQSGALHAIDPSGGDPALRITFHNHDGRVVAVDLKGEHLDYLGDLAVDASAKPLFEQVWKLAHCQAP